MIHHITHHEDRIAVGWQKIKGKVMRWPVEMGGFISFAEGITFFIIPSAYKLPSLGVAMVAFGGLVGASWMLGRRRG